MQLSAEMRWFWRDTPPIGLLEQFGGGVGNDLDSRAELRIDRYLHDPLQNEIGIKLRGGKPGVEIKGLVKTVASKAVRPFTGNIEIWAKWTSQSLPLASNLTTAIDKSRWLRKFSTDMKSAREITMNDRPDEGCNVELTRIHLPDEEWWTFGLESFGPLDNIADSLRETATKLASGGFPDLMTGRFASYPTWLQTINPKVIDNAK